ncbi:MAG: nickel-responsive transcriptional regulator NikR [Candidatus Omnitrophica bacterium]|nr:nickel-responsive transcriptional regulator NikR [Candidatus Omnitrophota bacterium]MCM8827310.1 nickel-responsive transcriptional regulator NikR [Candidatus Omnitrophota bacterium]
MRELVRFGVSIDKGLSDKFDALIKKKGYSNRSEAIRDLIREYLVKKEWEGEDEVVGAITLIYDHHRREILDKLTDIQHSFIHLIVSSQHVHLDHHNCLEIVAVKGLPKSVCDLADKLKAVKGVKHSTLSMSTTGKQIV